MNMEQMLMVARALGILIAVLYMVILKPYIDSAKAKLEVEKEKVLAELTEQERLELRDCVEDAVQAAEKVLKSETGKKKKEKVLETVTEKLNTLTHLTLTAAELDALIEAFVYAIDPK